MGITSKNFGAISITRNSIIASMLFRIDYIEQMGTGIRRMRNATREANVAEPEFEFSGFFKVTFKRDESSGHGQFAYSNNSERLRFAYITRRISTTFPATT